MAEQAQALQNNWVMVNSDKIKTSACVEYMENEMRLPVIQYQNANVWFRMGKFAAEVEQGQD